MAKLKKPTAGAVKEKVKKLKAPIANGGGGSCSEGYHWDDVLKKCVENVG